MAGSNNSSTYTLNILTNIGQSKEQIASLRKELQNIDRIKIGAKLFDGLNESMDNVSHLGDVLKQSLESGFKSKGDSTKFSANLDAYIQNLSALGDGIEKLQLSDKLANSLDFSKILSPDKLKQLTSLRDELRKLSSDFGNAKNAGLGNVQGAMKGVVAPDAAAGLKATKGAYGALHNVLGQGQAHLKDADASDATAQQLRADAEAIKAALATYRAEVENARQAKTKADTDVADLQAQVVKDPTNAALKKSLQGKILNQKNKTNQLNAIETQFSTIESTANSTVDALNRVADAATTATNGAAGLSKQINDITGGGIDTLVGNLQTSGDAFRGLEKDAKNVSGSIKTIAYNAEDVNSTMTQVNNRFKTFFSTMGAFRTLRGLITSATQEIKNIDKAMTETAVVTDETIGTMWEKLPQYVSAAKAYGVGITDVINAQTLYVQQGLDMETSMGLAIESIKMARVAGIQTADATQAMTAAMHGFNMELNATSAQRINDVYSKLAQITAADTKQIATAMSKVASIANSAGMEFENVSAFLAQIIETTQEAPETAGTALKTVVARFSEVKKLYSEAQLEGTDDEGDVVNVNKIQEALKTANIDMTDFFLGNKGLDDILIELAGKWNTLTTVQQRY